MVLLVDAVENVTVPMGALHFYVFRSISLKSIQLILLLRT